MKRITLLLILGVTVLVFVATALAAPPVRETFEYDYDYQLPVDCGLLGVGDFSIRNHEVGSARITSYYDNEGNLIKEKGHVNGTDHIYAEGYPANVVAGTFATNWTTVVNPSTGEFTFSHEPGNWWHIVLPGHGNIVHFAGLQTYQYDPDVDDWHIIKDQGLRYVDLVPLCEHLAPQP